MQTEPHLFILLYHTYDVNRHILCTICTNDHITKFFKYQKIYMLTHLFKQSLCCLCSPASMAVSRIPGVLILFLVLVSLSFSDAKLTRSLKLHLLDRHNKARQDARSPNMRRMVSLSIFYYTILFIILIRLILIIIVHSQEWSQPLAIIAEDTARSCSNEPASKNILSAAVGSKFSWVGENRQLISSAVQVNQSVLNQVLNCWLTGTADCQYKETNQVQVSYCQTKYHLNEVGILEIFGTNNYHITLTS